MINMKNIHKINNKYHIIKNIYNQRINYGKYTNKKEAQKQRNLLEENNWIKSEKTGYNKKESFTQYKIIQKQKQYYITSPNKTTYGPYQDEKYAQIIQKILPYHKKPNIKQIEKKATKEYYKHITYNKTNKRYYLNIKNKTYASSKKLKNILHERDLLLKYNTDEELMCENTNTIQQQEEIPPFPDIKGENIYQITSQKNQYIIRKQKNNKSITIGSYPTYELALLIKSYLDFKNWNQDSINTISTITDEIQNRNRYIYKKNENYCIKKYKNGNYIYYGYYDDINEAIFVKNNLINCGWKKELVSIFKSEFDPDTFENNYFYDTTDFFENWKKLT